MKLKILVALSVIAAAVLIVYSQTKTDAFAPAGDFPRDAVLYVQIADLPALVKLWNESEFKQNYLESANYKDFKNNHLGRKLASRWQEFNEAAGFSIDLEMLGRLAGKQAAVALYDVGKLEFVFIAPASYEIFAATEFAVKRDKFTEETLEAGTTVYRVSVAANRGRQKQEVIFTQTNGRFIAATSEKLLAQTLSNINDGKTKNRLIDEPSFKLLTEKIEPHAATVWLNQTVLNDDYYFKRYWLMSDVKDLENMRAGVFDFEMQTGKFIERRKFLLDQPVASAPLENAEAARMLSFLPAEIPFYRLRTATPKTINESVEQTIDARRQAAKTKRRNNSSRYLAFDDYDDYSGNNYEFLSENYDEAIDDADDVETIERSEIEIDFSKIIQPTKPRAILTFTQPLVLPAPLFAEFRRAAIFNLAAGASFNRDAFESAIIQKLAAQTMIDQPGANLKWETETANNFAWHRLDLPMLYRNVSYSIQGDLLILTNNADYLQNIFLPPSQSEIAKQTLPFDALTVIDFGEKENAYDRVFEQLNNQRSADQFFKNNVESLLNSISEIKRVEIREFYSEHTLNEEITINY